MGEGVARSHLVSGQLQPEDEGKLECVVVGDPAEHAGHSRLSTLLGDGQPQVKHCKHAV